MPAWEVPADENLTLFKRDSEAISCSPIHPSFSISQCLQPAFLVYAWPIHNSPVKKMKHSNVEWMHYNMVNPGLKVKNWLCHWKVGDHLTSPSAQLTYSQVLKTECWSKNILDFGGKSQFTSTWPFSIFSFQMVNSAISLAHQIVKYRKCLKIFPIQFIFISCQNMGEERFVLLSLGAVCQKHTNDIRTVQESLLKGLKNMLKVHKYMLQFFNWYVNTSTQQLLNTVTLKCKPQFKTQCGRSQFQTVLFFFFQPPFFLELR